MSDRPQTVEAYIAGFPPEIQERLRAIRRVLSDAWPDATEGISYQIAVVRPPEGRPIYFGAWKHHIGLYPIARLEEPLESEVAPLRRTKDSVGLAHREPLPLDLIRRVVEALQVR